MISLKKILYEVLNNYSVEVDLFVDKSAAVYDITNEIRALQGVKSMKYRDKTLKRL